MLKKFCITLSFVAVLPGLSLAQEELIPEEVFAQAERYADSVGCYEPGRTFVRDETQVVELRRGTEVVGGSEPIHYGSYLVFALSNVGCVGGMYQQKFLPIVVEKDLYSHGYSVKPEQSAPQIVFEEVHLGPYAQFDVAVRGVDILDVSWLDYGENDEMWQPTIERTTTLVRDAEGNWRVL